MTTFCNACLEIYFDGIIPKVQGICPKANCGGSLVEVDEMLAPVILLLNTKGYRQIVDCCSGHAHMPNSMLFICFDDNLTFEDCPHGFELHYPNHSSTQIEKIITEPDILQRQTEIFKAILYLKEWAYNLEACY